MVEGDPHYHTFDNQIHHFMGTCTYTLSKLCESNSSLPYFNVEAANEHRGGNTRVSYVQYVDVDVYGQRIRLGKGGVVTVSAGGSNVGAVSGQRTLQTGCSNSLLVSVLAGQRSGRGAALHPIGRRAGLVQRVLHCGRDRLWLESEV